MSADDATMDGDPTLVLLRRLGNDLRSLRGQVPRRLQAVRTAQSRTELVRAEYQWAQLAARMQAKQEEVVAMAAALPDDVRTEHEDEVNEILSIYPRKPAAS
ncbi:MAG: hypothetical protein M3Y31_05870 [Gemmatimonadota bacterium]|jgi:hypothetical protein|nr:hypothetical protein [Gemmatimonadota bacterium]